MPQTLAQKLRIKENDSLLTINAPKDFADKLEPLPAGVRIAARNAKPTQVHWFVQSRAQLEAELSGVLDRIGADTLCWTYYPKGTSKIKTDLTRDKGWEALLAIPGLQWLSLVSFDDTWSAFAFRRAGEKDAARTLIAERKAGEAKPIDEWIDKDKREVRFPPDLQKALKGMKEETAFLTSLSFTNKKEYVEWIVTAKKPETRAERVRGTVDRLAKRWKNPRNI